MKRYHLLIISLIVLGSLHAQSVPQNIQDNIQNTINTALSSKGLKGVGVTVAFPNGAMWSTSAGIVKDNVPIDTSKYFRFASYTKFLTSIMIMQLHEAGELSIDDSLKDYLEPIPNVDENLTIRELLQHTATVGDYFQSASAIVQQHPDSIFVTRQTMIDHVPAAINPAKNFSYNNSNFNLLGLVIEAVTGNSGEDEFDSRIIQPLGLTDVHLAPVDLPESALNGTWFDMGSGLINVGSVSVNGILTAHRYSGGAAGTTKGMLKILKAHLHHVYLKDETLQLMLAPSPKNGSYGLGTMIRDVNGDKLYGHGGSIAQSTRTFYNPENHIGVSVGINHAHSDAVESLFRQIYTLSKDGLHTLNVDSKQKVLPALKLHQNHPNPFNPSTTIRYGLPEASDVSLVLYDITGRKVKTLVNVYQAAGWYDIQWNGTNDLGYPVSSGNYVARIQAGSFTDVMKMVFLK